MEKFNCEGCNNDNCLICNFCSEEWKAILDKHKVWGTFQKNQYIFYEGAPVYGIYFIQSGKVKVITSRLDNKQKILRLAKPGDILGHRGFGSKYYGIGAVALEPTVVCFIESDIFFKALKANNELTFQLMLFYAQELYKSEQHSKNISLMPAKVRVADTFVNLTDKFGIAVNNKWKLDINLSRQEIAEISSTTPELVSRSITEFKKEKLITTSGRQILITNLEKLIDLIRPYDHLNLQFPKEMQINYQ